LLRLFFRFGILTEEKLLAVARQPVKDLLIVIQDTGMHRGEVFRIRTENINWNQRLIFNSNGKTRAACGMYRLANEC
jgi:integrase